MPGVPKADLVCRTTRFLQFKKVLEVSRLLRPRTRDSGHQWISARGSTGIGDLSRVKGDVR